MRDSNIEETSDAAAKGKVEQNKARDGRRKSASKRAVLCGKEGTDQVSR